MHPDRKIGIAMGILLVGVVGALFFRNEPLDEQADFGMRREQELNERLKERDVAVYFEDGDPVGEEVDEVERQLQKLMQTDLYPDDPAATQQPAAKRSITSHPPAISHDGVLIDPSGNLRPARPTAQLQHEPAASAGHGPTPQPGDSSDGRGGAIANARSDAVIPQPERDDFAAAEPQYEEYTVQFGDTLSEIAERFLGSQTRYRDIYEANKDRMASPDQLKVGKAIRIPRVYR